MCACVCVRACVRARACVRVRACVCVCVRACVHQAAVAVNTFVADALVSRSVDYQRGGCPGAIYLLGNGPLRRRSPALCYGPGEPADPFVTVFDKTLALG